MNMPPDSIRGRIRKYDWSKTLNDVLVLDGNGRLMLHGNCAHPTKWMSDIWQPNIHGKCPVDGEACWVRVKRANGRDSEDMLASSICWEFGFGAATIIAWQFIRLADGVEW